VVRNASGSHVEANFDRPANDLWPAGHLLSYPGSRKHRTKASISVPRKFNHTHDNNMINR
jgi:hypothetical protein